MKSAAVISVILCLVHLNSANAKLKVYYKSIEQSDKELIFGRQFQVDGRLTYALCDKLQTDKIKCTVIREKHPFGDENYSCNVTLERGDEYETNYSPHITIFPFGENNVALSYFETGGKEKYNYVKFTTVQLDNCTVGNTQVETKYSRSLASPDYTFVGHNHSFDVIFAGHEWNGKTSRATINADGQLINGPAPSPVYFNDIGIGVIIRNIVSLDNDSSSGGYFYFKAIDHDEHIYQQVLIKADGTEKFLSEPVQLIDPVFPISTKNNLIGACYQTKSICNCTQYDFDGNVKLQATIAYDNSRYEALADIHNLPNGGFYLLRFECVKDSHQCHVHEARIVIERIDINGMKTGSLNYEGLKTPKKYEWFYWSFYENETNDTCVSIVFENPMQINANCFTDADFK